MKVYLYLKHLEKVNALACQLWSHNILLTYMKKNFILNIKKDIQDHYEIGNEIYDIKHKYEKME